MKLSPFKLIIASSLLIFSIPISAQECKEHFERAERYREKGQYNKALQFYTKSRDCGDAAYQTKSAAMIQNIKDLIKEQDNVKASQSGNDYIIVPSLIYLPSGIEEQIIVVESSGQWSAKGLSNTINVSKKNSRTLSVSSLEPNTATQPRKSSVVIECGEISRVIVVEQDGAPEQLEYKTKYLKIPPIGGDFIVDIRTNTKWHVKSSYDWYKAHVMEEDSTRMIIHVDSNFRNMERTGTIEVESESGESRDILSVYQYPNESNIFTPLEGQISFTEKRDTVLIPVLSENEFWTVSDCPSWCQETKMNADTLMIVVAANDTYSKREGYVNIKSGDRVEGIFITQAASVPSYNISKKVIEGRNISFGITGGITYPIIAAAAGGTFMGSAVNYSYGNSSETANYQSYPGLSLGAFADIRLYRNLFLIAGVDYTRYTYGNIFSSYAERDVATSMPDYYFRGMIQDQYTEKYTFNLIDIPILLSYRIPITNASHLQFNIGPVISCGISSTLDLNGSSDGVNLKAYVISNHQKTDIPKDGVEAKPRHVTSVGGIDLYRKTANYTVTYREGNNEKLDQSTNVEAEPFHRMNLGARIGVAYELHGIKLSIEYNNMLSNMANSKYWESNRWMIFDQPADVIMSGYKQHNHTLQLKLGYTFRY